MHLKGCRDHRIIKLTFTVSHAFRFWAEAHIHIGITCKTKTKSHSPLTVSQPLLYPNTDLLGWCFSLWLLMQSLCVTMKDVTVVETCVQTVNKRLIFSLYKLCNILVHLTTPTVEGFQSTVSQSKALNWGKLWNCYWMHSGGNFRFNLYKLWKNKSNSDIWPICAYYHTLWTILIWNILSNYPFIHMFHNRII